MTVIKRIKATGFKSFAKPTELKFGNDFSGVIGPNGSGKSNVVDSLCFVLGRLSAKSLRANKATNLIYNGGKTGNAAKSAEVSIVFDNKNTDYFDVIINRDDCHERKPHPQPILTALEKLNTDPERAMYVGDKQVDDIISGNSVGMTTVLVNSGEVDRYCAKPDYHVSSPREILSVFMRQ